MKHKGLKKFRVSIDDNVSPGPGSYDHMEMNRASIQVMQ